MTPPHAAGGQCDPVRPTLTPAAAAAIDWHCVVIGAGPAGAATAIRLARHGLRVLLIDRSPMPRPKVCGCCLSPLAVAELASLCPPDALPTPLPLATVRLLSAGGAARIPMAGGGVLSREALDAALVLQAIDAGADWLPHMVAESIHDGTAASGEKERLTLTARAAAPEPEAAVSLHARVAVIAAGLADTIRIVPAEDRTATAGTPSRPSHQSARSRHVAAGSRIGLGTTLAATSSGFDPAVFNLPSGELVMAVDRHGYCGIVRLEDGRIDLAAAVDRQLLGGDGGPAAAIARLLHAAGAERLVSAGGDRLQEAIASASFRATPPLTHHSPRIAGTAQRIFRVGDAAGYVEPFTGEGIGWALASGRILAAALLADAGIGGPLTAADVAAARYQQLHDRLFAPQHARCRRVARGVRHPAVVAGAVRLANALPRAAAWALPRVTGAAGRV